MKQYETNFNPWDEAADRLQENERLTPTDTPEGADDVSANDPFGLYLHQMGAIPMLSRPKELELAGRLERLRRRYRRAALWSAAVLTRAADTFEQIKAGTRSLDHSIDAVP